MIDQSDLPGPQRPASSLAIDTDSLAVSSWSWHAAYSAGTWSLLDLPAAAASAGITAIECNGFMLPPPRFSRIRRPLLSLMPGAPPELWRYSRASLRQLLARARTNEGVKRSARLFHEQGVHLSHPR